MKRKTCLAYLLAAVLLASLFAGCAGSGGDAPATDPSSSTPAETAEAASSSKEADPAPAGGESIRLVLEGSDSIMAKTTSETFQSVLDSYTAATGTQVEFLFVPDQDYRTWQTTQQAAGTMPEVYATKLAWVWEDYAKNQAIEMTGYLEEESPYNPGQPWKDTFIDFQLAQTLDPVSQKHVSALRYLVAVRIAYNKDIFAEAGVTGEPTTWKEFIEACQKIQAAGKTPFAFALQSGSQLPSWFLTTLFGQLDEGLRKQMDVDGDQMVSKNEFAKATDEGLIDYTADPFKTGFELLTDFSQYWNSDFNAIDTPSSQQLWQMGDAAMMACLSSDLNAIAQIEGRDFEYGVFPLPLVTEETTPLASGKCTMLGGAANESWAISSTTSGAKLDASVDLIRWLTAPEAQTQISSELCVSPVITNVDLPAGMEGFAMRDYEDIRRANYTGPATLNEFSTFLTMSLQLYLTGETGFDQFAADLNEEWTGGMKNAMESSGWSAENNYGIGGE